MFPEERPLDSRFNEVNAQWRAIVTPKADVDSDRFALMQAEARDIRARGLWSSGPADLLTILGRHRNEIFHSRLLGWLMQPTGRHGLGDRFLRALLEDVWPGEHLHDGTPVEIELERTQSGMNADATELHEARADLVVGLDSVVIVIENKLDAGEQPHQCERLYWAWAADPIEVRWLYLTPTGRSPATATSPEALAAWRTASYAQIRRVLAAVLDETSNAPPGAGRSSALQYLMTLSANDRNRLGGNARAMFEDERLNFYLRNRDEIREWAAIENDVVTATRELLAASQAALEERLATVDPDAITSRRDGGRWQRILVQRPGWPAGVGVALEWEERVDPFGSVPPKYGIIFLNGAPDLVQARLRIASIATSTPDFSASRFKVPGDSFWPIYRKVDKSQDWWQDPEAWTGRIVEALIDLWPKAVPVIDEGLGQEP